MRKRGFREFSILRSMLVEAPSSAGELEMLVMKYVRSTWESGRIANGAAARFVSFAASGGDAADGPLAMGSEDIAAGFDCGGEVWRARLLALLRPPSWNTHT